MGGISAANKILLNKGMSILKKTQLGTILFNQLAPLAFPSAAANGFVKYDAAGTAMEAVAYGTSSNTVCQGNDARIPTSDEKAGLAANTPTASNPVQTLTEVQEIMWKAPVRAATIAALPACTPSGSGVGKLLTGDANGALAAQDGVTMAAGERLLVKNQVAGADNGIYVVTTLGDGSNPFVLTRAVDADTSDKMTSGLSVVVQEGNINKDKVMVLTTNEAITLDTTALSFAFQRHNVYVFTETIGHADLTAAATEEAITLSSPPTNCIILGGCIELDTDFSGGSVSALTAEIGDAADPNELAAAVDVFTGAGAGLKDGEPTAVTGLGFKTAYAPQVRFAATGDNVINLSAGSLNAHLYYVPVDTLT